MAEGLLRAIYGYLYEVYSAGIEAKDVDPRAVFVMREIGIDISAQRSKTFHEYQDMVFDLVVTVCDRAKQACPICSTPEVAGPGILNEQPWAKKVIHKSFEDPARATGSDEDQLNVFRQIRDDIKGWISLTFG